MSSRNSRLDAFPRCELISRCCSCVSHPGSSGRCAQPGHTRKGDGYDCSHPRTGFISLPALLTMLLEHFADDVVVWAPAKVNLHLEILGKRQDGFHEVETLMAAVSLCDTLVQD